MTDSVSNIELHIVTCEAGHLPTDRHTYLTAIEGVEFNIPLPIEHVHIGTEFDMEMIRLSVWHNRGWMFGIDLALDDVITFQYHGEKLDIPSPPDRTDQVRIHGTWHPRGSVEWAPNEHPTPM